MAVATAHQFDLETFKRGYEEWDIDALLALYADDVELVQIDRDNPPSAPRIRHGKDMFKGMFEHCAGAGVKASVENRSRAPIASPRRSPASSRAAARSWPTGSSSSRTAASSASCRSCPAIPGSRTKEIDDAEGVEGKPHPSMSRSRAMKATSSTSRVAGRWASRATRRTPTWPPTSRGFPNDECQCEHMGYVIKGKLAFRSGDTEEVFEARRRVLRRPGPYPGALRRHRGGRVQPHRGARPDHGGRDPQHGGDATRVLLSVTRAPASAGARPRRSHFTTGGARAAPPRCGCASSELATVRSHDGATIAPHRAPSAHRSVPSSP